MVLRADFYDPQKDEARFTPDAEVDALLHGAVDLHQHPGPGPIPRRMTILEAVEDAALAGFRAIVCKSHHDNTAPMLDVLRTAGMDDFGVQVLGGVALNWYTGGTSPLVVENALYSGAKIIWMPTVSSAAHLAKDHAPTSVFANPPVKLGPPILVEEGGAPKPEVREIFDLVAAYDAILNFGHLSADEIDVLLPAAVEAGVQRMIVSHPPLLKDASPERVGRWTAMGARIEHVLVTVRRYGLDLLDEYVAQSGIDATFLSSDYGQMHNPLPVAGYRAITRSLLDHGWPEEKIKKFVSGTAGTLITGLS